MLNGHLTISDLSQHTMCLNFRDLERVTELDIRTSASAECICLFLQSQLLITQVGNFDDGPAFRERLRTHKAFRKDQCFYLNYHKFSIKSYVVDVY